MCLRKTDWLTTIHNREISPELLSPLSVVSCIRDNVDVNRQDVIQTLHILCLLKKIIAELDYQSYLEYTKYVGLTIEYNYPNEY